MKIDIEVTGVKELIKSFKGYEVKAEAAINKAVDDTAVAIKADAQMRLMMSSEGHVYPKMNIKTHQQTGFGGAGLLGSIYNRIVKSMERVVGTSKHYAPYIEFGTGDLVFTNSEFDEEARETASKFKGKGIRKVNIRGTSFLNWAAVHQGKKHIERIIKNLNAINR
jgi:hypothetical protein